MRYKDRDREEEAPPGLDIDIPDVSDFLGEMREVEEEFEDIRGAHQEQMDKEEEEVKTGKRKKPRQKPKGGTVCFCGNPHCNIGEFIEQQT